MAYTYSKQVADQQAALNKQGANLKVDGFLGPLTKSAISKYTPPANLTSNIDSTGTALVSNVGPGTTINPVVQTSDAATKDLNNIKTNVTDINTNIKNQNAKLAADKLAADQKASADAAAKLTADQKNKELSIKEKALSDGNVPAGWDATTYANFKAANPGLEPDAEDTARMNGTYNQLQLDKANAAYEKATADYENEAQGVHNTILNIQNGSVPLSSGEQAMVDGLKQSYQQLIETQKLQNTGAQGLENIRGYQLGSAEYDPTFQVKTIGGIITAGLQKVAALNTQMASAVATMTQGFKDNKIKAIKDAWDVYNEAVTKRQALITHTINTATKAIETAAALQEKARTEQIVVRKDINGVAALASKNFAPPEIIAAINAATTVGEAIAAAGQYGGDQLDRELKLAQIEEAKAGVQQKLADAEKTRGETAAADPKVIALKAQSTVLDNITLVDSVLNSPYLGQVTGLKNPFTYWTPGTNEQYVKAQLNQVINSLSLENRSKLKGQGAVSDFEGRMLAKASSSLTPSLSDEDAKRELHKIRGIFSTAAGFTATVKITAPDGTSKVLESDRNGIDQAIIDGLTVEYQ